MFLSDGCDYILEQKVVHQVSAIAWSLRGSRHRQSRASSLLGLKTKTKFFDYQEPFSRFYRDFGVNENGNGYRKYRNENDIFIQN